MTQIRMFACAVAAAAVSMTGIATAGEVDGGLEEIFALNRAQGRDDQVVSALVYLWDQGDIAALAEAHRARRAPFAQRNEEVVRALRDTAAVAQAELLRELAGLRNRGEVVDFEAYWIANVVRVDATERVLRKIAERPDVKIVYYNMPIVNIVPTVEPVDVARGEGGGDASRANGPEPGVVAVRAPEVWAMGYTGEGVLIATMDSGVDGSHPALASRWRGLDPAYANNPEWAWFDPITLTQFPEEFAFSSHGTHTTGTVVGGLPGDQIGVAPGAQWISAGVIDRGGIDATIANAIASFQWMANPTGNPADWWAVPRVCSNSWGTVASHGHPACDETFWVWIDNSEAAGTAQVFSAGNEGGSGLRRPADRATSEYHSMAVGAVDPHTPGWPVGNFSSLGPTYCTPDGTVAIKPDIAAPGVSTRSAVSGGGYGSKSGTSMASPHVNGVMALMLEACDLLTADELKQIIYDTAFDLGAPGKDNTYGWGMIDAEAAVLRALETCGISVKLVDSAPEIILPGQQATFRVQVISGMESPVQGSELLVYRINGEEFQSALLQPLGDGLYEATLPIAMCDEVIEYYVQVTGDGGTVVTSPRYAPDMMHTAHVGEIVTETVLDQTFAAGMPAGWSATGLWNITNQCGVSGSCAGEQWAYYGVVDSCTYQTGSAPNSGELLSVMIDVPEIPPLGHATVSFCYNLETEASQNYDVASFSIEGEEPVILADASSWTTFTKDITAFGGQSIVLRWHFNTFDGIANSYRGWQIDGVKITVTGLHCDSPNICQGDITGDGVVDVSDMLAVLSAWGACEGCSADMNDDGVVDVSDLLAVLASWGPCQ